MKRSIVRGGGGRERERKREREDVRAWEAWAGWFEMREKVGREKQRRRERYGKRVSTNVKSCEGIYSGVLLSCFLAVAHGRDSLFWVLCKANMHVMPCASPNTPTPTPSQGLLPLLSVISSPLSLPLPLFHSNTREQLLTFLITPIISHISCPLWWPWKNFELWWDPQFLCLKPPRCNPRWFHIQKPLQLLLFHLSALTSFFKVLPCPNPHLSPVHYLILTFLSSSICFFKSFVLSIIFLLSLFINLSTLLSRRIDLHLLGWISTGLLKGGVFIPSSQTHCHVRYLQRSMWII